jgi:hypothetical protein
VRHLQHVFAEHGFVPALQQTDLQLAASLTRTCVEFYKRSPGGLAPEFVEFKDGTCTSLIAGLSVLSFRICVADAGWAGGWWLAADPKVDFVYLPDQAFSLLRPETVESLFLMWRCSTLPASPCSPAWLALSSDPL